ncbi:putative hydro-lyase [Halomonas binhaiensis]|uniref:Putative hydro-lyase E4T21_01260 n=1 Tax=Halomonas binhaiensis TaxID=2562282 RepID=A0A5C1NE31_9GAMM|nr:putative hydro-lyase [Halomonas binhaiensis]QEM80337.1 putative hydro-lyase [Halomonas binhaiensis]
MAELALNATSTPQQARRLIRDGHWQQHTSGLAAGHAQANLVILPEAQADDFLRFCQANPKPCPVLDVTAPGDPYPRSLGDDIDLRYDLPTYRVYRDGKLSEERHDITDLWRDDFVAFSIGCSFSFEEALIAEGLEVRHISERRNVPMYRTNIPLIGSRLFGGEMVVSMRPFTAAQAIRAIQITSDMPRVHGAPIHLGDPAQIGISDLQQPDFGDSPVIHQGEIPVFWACGVTPQLALENAALPLVITHSPGHMLITDIPNHRFKFG